jgi:hypothetical protein
VGLGGEARSNSPREGFEVVDTFVVDASLASMQLPDVGVRPTNVAVAVFTARLQRGLH